MGVKWTWWLCTKTVYCSVLRERSYYNEEVVRKSLVCKEKWKESNCYRGCEQMTLDRIITRALQIISIQIDFIPLNIPIKTGV